MTSSLITALTVTTPTLDRPPAPVTDGEHGGLLDALAKIPDPRDPRGIRYPLSALLTVAVCAVLAGASSFAAITDWLQDLDGHARDRLGFDRIPSGTTMWRLLTLCRSKSHRCWSSGILVLVDEAAEDAGAVQSVSVEVVYRGRVLLGVGW
jgi:hypothetical protein